MRKQKNALILKPERNNQELCASASKSNKIFQHLHNNQHKEAQAESSYFPCPDGKRRQNFYIADRDSIMDIEKVSGGTLQLSCDNVELRKFLIISNSSMELTFLGNKYAKSETTSIRPAVQLKYMGKSYFAEQIKSFRNSIFLTYRGVSYSRV